MLGLRSIITGTLFTGMSHTGSSLPAEGLLQRRLEGLIVSCSVAFALATSALAQEPLFTFLTEHANTGFHVATAGGDVNGDGWPDLLLGSPNDSDFRGLVLVKSGRDGRTLFRFKGARAGALTGTLLGVSLAALGDMDADGYGDFAIGSLNGTGPGEVRLYSGKSGKVLRSIQGGTKWGGFGSRLAVLLDRKRDGMPTLVIGAPMEAGVQSTRPGAIYVVSTKTGKTIYKSMGVGPSDLYGVQIVRVQDLDGDGYDDFAVGARNGGIAQSGYVELVSGKQGRILHTWKGASTGDKMGDSLANVGDTDGDGVCDLLAGTTSALQGKGSATLFSGKTKKVIRVHLGTKWAQSYFGTAVSGVGDLDGDRRDDYLVSEPSPRIGNPWGSVYLFSGKSGKRLWQLTGQGSGYRGYGGLISRAGDINRDGTPDFVVTAGKTSRGVLEILSGKKLTLRADKHSLSLTTGGTQTLLLQAGARHAHKLFWTLGSLSGVRPGIRLGALHLPLNPDAYTSFLIGNPNTLLLPTLGQLDSQGKARDQLRLPPGLPASLQGRVLDHAYLVWSFPSLSLDFASTSTPLLLEK